MEKKITSEQLAKDLLNPFKDVLLKGGIDDDYLIKQLKKEFENEEPKVIKSSGKLDSRSLPKNYKVIAKPTKDNPYGDTIIECRLHNLGISQKARMDVHKLRGDYPAEKHEHTGKDGGPIEHKHILDEEIEKKINAIYDKKTGS